MINRVVFFQPRTFASNNYRNSVGSEQMWPPWAALVLAPIVRQEGFAVTLIDARVIPDQWTTMLGKLGPTDILAVTVMTGRAIHDAVLASEIAKSNRCRVLWGGPHVSLFPLETLKQAPVDAIIPGFGYEPLSRLLRLVRQDGWPKRSFDGVFVRSDCSTGFPLTKSKNVGNFPIPSASLDLITDWEPYINPDVAIASRTISSITSEGCSRRCTYCSEPQTSNSTWYTREVSNVVKQTKDLCQQSCANGVKFNDPNFFHDMERAQRFAEDFSALVNLPWAATMHPADLAGAPDAALSNLSRHGLVRLLVGLESPDPKIVRLAGKQYDPAHIPELARKLARFGIRGMFTYIVGWPNAAPEHYAQTVDSAFEIREIWEEHQAKIHFLEPWPGTPIFRLLTRRGAVFPATLSEWADIDYYQARYSTIHNSEELSRMRKANEKLSPYVDA